MKKKMVSEAKIMKLILDEFNDNSIGLEFSSSIWGGGVDGEPLMIQRRTFTNDRFDVKDIFDEQTYSSDKVTFVPTDISDLNADYLTHPEIQEITFSPQMLFLVKADDATWVTGVREVIEEVRTKLMQKEVIYDIKQIDLERGVEEIETYKGVYSTGSMDYGTSVVINGKSYLMFSLEVNLFLTNFGEFANQQEFTFYISDTLDNLGKPIPFNVPLLTWDYGTAVDTEAVQPLLDFDEDNIDASEVRSYNNAKAYTLSFRLTIDFKNEFLKRIYIYSVKRHLKIPTIYVDHRTFYYEKNTNTGLYDKVELTEARNQRSYTAIINKPNEELSLGDKLDYLLTLTPNIEGWFE